MKNKTIILGLALSVIACNLTSCDKIKETAGAIDSATATSKLLTDAEELQKAEDALKNMPLYKDKDVKVFQNVYFYGGDYPRIIIELVNPDNGEDVDHYEYQNGSWSAPQPVQISGDGDMGANTTPLNDIKFATVAKIAETWKEKAASLEGAVQEESEYISFVLWVPNQTRKWSTDDIETPRAEYGLSFNMDGSLEEFEKK